MSSQLRAAGSLGALVNAQLLLEVPVREGDEVQPCLPHLPRETRITTHSPRAAAAAKG
jgi:hypothetical protein